MLWIIWWEKVPSHLRQPSVQRKVSRQVRLPYGVEGLNACGRPRWSMGIFPIAWWGLGPMSEKSFMSFLVNMLWNWPFSISVSLYASIFRYHSLLFKGAIPAFSWPLFLTYYQNSELRVALEVLANKVLHVVLVDCLELELYLMLKPFVVFIVTFLSSCPSFPVWPLFPSETWNILFSGRVQHVLELFPGWADVSYFFLMCQAKISNIFLNRLNVCPFPEVFCFLLGGFGR